MELEDDSIGSGPVYRSPKTIDPNELTEALKSLFLPGDDLYLRMQAVNLASVDPFIMGLEYEVLRKFIDEERLPVPEVMFLSAQSQMWIFAAYELLRTWRAQAKDILKWSKAGHLSSKIAALEKDQGFRHVGHQMRADQLRKIVNDPSLIERIETDLRICHIPFRRIEFIRMALAKHEVAKQPNSIAYAPGYGRVNQWCGSLDYQMDKGQIILGNISRRDIADELRAMKDRSAPPSQDDIDSFDAFMDAKFPGEFDLS